MRDRTGHDGRLGPRFSGHLSVRSLSAKVDGDIILSHVSLDVAQGEIVGLLGRDGAGKTTCFEALAGLIPAASGHVLLNGVDITDWPFDRRALLGLTYLSEEPSIFRGLTVEQNISAALEASEPASTDRAAYLEDLLSRFELLAVRSQLANTLSGGERRRCEVARAMALKPTILLLDEPFRGLDPTSIESTKRLIGGLKNCQVGVLVTDYDLHDLLDLTDRVYVLHDGRLIFRGSADEFLADSGVRRVFLGEGFTL